MTPFPEPVRGKPLWLVTLADLALLLVGFFVLLQAHQRADGAAIARSLRAQFGETQVPPPLPVAAANVRFATGSARIESGLDAARAFARDAARDPRVALTITGAVDGAAADVDLATGSGAILAADRARALAAAIAGSMPHRTAAHPLAIVTARRPLGAVATVTLAFVGEDKDPQ